MLPAIPPSTWLFPNLIPRNLQLVVLGAADNVRVPASTAIKLAEKLAE